MRTLTITMSALLLAFALAGCLGDTDPRDGTGQNGDTDGFEPQWPDVEAAEIRPGVQIRTDGHGWCTTNFVFTAANGTIYIGTAAHCVDASIGADVRLQQDPDFHTGQQGPVIGTVAYSAWAIEEVHTEPCFVVLSCGAGDGNTANDFALIKINDEYRDKVHPAVLHFGGPTELAKLDDIQEGDKVLSYGNSPLRPGPTPLDWKEGYISAINAPWTVTACMITSGVPGDSGSNSLLGDGRALGIVVTLGVAPPCGTVNGITILDTALEFAREHGFDVELATWDLLDEGLLPEQP